MKNRPNSSFSVALAVALTVMAGCLSPTLGDDGVMRARLGSLRRDDTVVVDVKGTLNTNAVREIIGEYDRSVILPREDDIITGSHGYPVTSVNGKTGEVVLAVGDISGAASKDDVSSAVSALERSVGGDIDALGELARDTADTMDTNSSFFMSMINYLLLYATNNFTAASNANARAWALEKWKNDVAAKFLSSDDKYPNLKTSQYFTLYNRPLVDTIQTVAGGELGPYMKKADVPEWAKSNSPPVSSVNGKTGEVTLSAGDISDAVSLGNLSDILFGYLKTGDVPDWAKDSTPPLPKNYPDVRSAAFAARRITDLGVRGRPASTSDWFVVGGVACNYDISQGKWVGGQYKVSDVGGYYLLFTNGFPTVNFTLSDVYSATVAGVDVVGYTDTLAKASQIPVVYDWAKSEDPPEEEDPEFSTWLSCDELELTNKTITLNAKTNIILGDVYVKGVGGFDGVTVDGATNLASRISGLEKVVDGGPYLPLSGGTMRIPQGGDGLVVVNGGASLGGMPGRSWVKGGVFGIGPTMINGGFAISGPWFDYWTLLNPNLRMRINLPTDRYPDREPVEDGVELVDGGTLALRSDVADALADGLSAFASTGSVARAAAYGTPTRWTDATGCVWEVSLDEWVVKEDQGLPDGVHVEWSGPYWLAEDDGMSYTGDGWYVSNSHVTPERASADSNAVEIVFGWGYYSGDEYVAVRTVFRRVVRTNAVDRTAFMSEVKPVVVVAPTMNATSGSAADARVTGAALYGGYTEWEASEPGYYIIRYGDGWSPCAPDGSIVAMWAGDIDSTNLLWYLEDIGGPRVITATRHRITPTKVSHLENDSGFTALSDAQISAIDSSVAASPTVVVYHNGRTDRLDIVGVLSSNSVPDKISAVSVRIGTSVTDIGNDAFRGCSSLSSVSIPDTVSVIGTDAFRDCVALPYVKIPDSVTEIKTRAFFGCTAMTRAVFPRSVTRVLGGTFQACSQLRSVEIPASVSLIAGNTFYGCVKLVSLDIPGSVTTLQAGCFSNCPNLSRVTFHGRTLAEVMAMSNYGSWGIDAGAIRTDMPLSGKTYDFSTDAGRNMAVRDIVEALGGKVINFPAAGQ